MHRLHDSLLTRLSNDDDVERNLSTFANEMTSAAMILGVLPMRFRRGNCLNFEYGRAGNIELFGFDRRTWSWYINRGWCRYLSRYCGTINRNASE